MVGVGGAAAVAAAIVGILVLNQTTTSSTFSNTGAEVGNGNVPAIAGPALAPPSIQSDSTNYNSTSAKSLLVAIYDGVAQPSAQGGDSSPTFSAERKSVSAADQATYTDQISRCESEVFSHGSGGARAIAYIVGRYENTPVFFLIYSVVVGGTTRSEMWVVQRSNCYIRLFLAPQ